MRFDWTGSVPTPIALNCDASRRVGALTPGPCPRNPRNWVLGLFAILAQSCRLWFDCRFKAIMTQFRRIAANCHQSAPRIAPAFRSNRNRTRIDPDKTGKKSAENARTAILTAIFTIEFNCGKIAKPRRIARGSP